MAKKDFTNNPAMSFISQESIDKVEGEPKKKRGNPTPKGGKAPAGYKPNPEYIETKSKRAQLLLQPSLYADAKSLSSELGISLNDFIHRAIHEATYNDHVKKLIQDDVKGNK